MLTVLVIVLWTVFIPFGIILGLVQLFWHIRKFVHWVSISKNKNLNKYGANCENSWAVITGASSGIGEKMVFEMCKTGFNLVIIARREAHLKRVQELCNELSPSCKVRIVLADLSKAYEIQETLMEQIQAVVGIDGEIRILMHMAGNSDLAVHLTDKTLVRNVEVMRLVVESTLVFVQNFTEMMCKRSKGRRCAILTCGALTAYTPAPTFAASSANKHYVRALTQALASEYDSIDFMIAHPIAVRSEILNGITVHDTGGWIIDADEFARNIIGEMGSGAVDLNGHWKHDLIVYILYELLPLSWVQHWFYKKRVSLNSQYLGRPIDSRHILEKF